MNPSIAKLQPYPFEKLAQLKAGLTPPAVPHIALSMGEPKHPAPAFVVERLRQELGSLTQYPATLGLPELRTAIANWANRRFQLEQPLDSQTTVLPVAGTREALFAIVQALVDHRNATGPAKIVMPNPFYQIYEGAAILAGAEPYFLNCTAETAYLPDLDSVPPAVWRDCQLLFLCSPGNPTGALMDMAYFHKALALADEYDFVIASDECYSELYQDESQPPVGLLQACAAAGRHNYARALVFHSLSKRSNLPGLRSGFVAGDARLLQPFLQYRTYQGCALPLPTQYASLAAWQDEEHVIDNRARYREKFKAVTEILAPVLTVTIPPGGFYLWPEVPGDDRDWARALFAATNVTVLPGQFLARDTATGNPGRGYVRIALVAPLDECVEAAWRIRRFMESGA
jgi:N-succinyldiaminopimelate aminotransferase